MVLSETTSTLTGAVVCGPRFLFGHLPGRFGGEILYLPLVSSAFRAPTRTIRGGDTLSTPSFVRPSANGLVQQVRPSTFTKSRQALLPGGGDTLGGFASSQCRESRLVAKQS